MRQTSLLIALIFSICVLHGQKSTFNIGFLLDNRNSEIDSLLNVLEDEIIAVVGEDAMVSFSKTNRLVNNFDKAIATKNYEQYLEGDIDIIIAFGIVNNATLYKRQNYPKPTIVFGFLSTELLQEIELKEDIENYISIVTTQSYREDLEYLVELAKPKRIGVVLEAGYLTSSPVESIFDKIGTDLQFEPKFISFEKFEDITANLDDIDALYLAGGYYLGK
jgi:outer membrane protein